MKKAAMKKGSILITVLIVVSVCASLAVFIHERAIASYGTVVTLHSEYQGAIYAMTAVQALQTAFQYDNENYDALDDIWNQIPPIPVDRGFMTVYISPLNSKFPMAALSIDNETVRERYEDGLRALMEKLDLDDEWDMNELKDWAGSGTPSSERFDENSAPYGMKSAQLQTLAELAYIPSFKNIYKKLSKYISIAGDGNKINLNTASEEVITSLLPELEPYVDTIISKRESEPLKNVSDLYEIMGSAMQDEYSTILPYIDVKSSLFYIKLELNIGDDNIYYHILAQRNGKSIKPIKYIEGGNVEYF